MRNQWFTRYKKCGFTLIELLVVIAIISILAAIAIPNYSNAKLKSQIAVTQQEIKALFTVIEQFKMDRGLMLADGIDGLTDWGRNRIINKFNSVGLTPEDQINVESVGFKPGDLSPEVSVRIMKEVLAPLTSPVSYI